jgi:hypothetical protein
MSLRRFNFFILQWTWFRLARVIDDSGQQTAWAIIGPVMPLSGWGRPYIGRPAPIVGWKCAS